MRTYLTVGLGAKITSLVHECTTQMRAQYKNHRLSSTFTGAEKGQTLCTLNVWWESIFKIYNIYNRKQKRSQIRSLHFFDSFRRRVRASTLPEEPQTPGRRHTWAPAITPSSPRSPRPLQAERHIHYVLRNDHTPGFSSSIVSIHHKCTCFVLQYFWGSGDCFQHSSLPRFGRGDTAKKVRSQAEGRQIPDFKTY